MSKKILGVALSLTALASIAGAVWASTTTNAPGAYCVATGGGSLSVRSDGEVENTTASTVTAVCPAERPIAPSTATQVSGTVFVIDRSSTADVCCKIMSKNAGGGVVQSTSVCSSGSSTSHQTLALPQITDGTTFSQYFVQCTVPPVSAGAASRIQLYRTTQS